MITRAMEGESTAFDRLVPGANGVRRWMTIRVVPGRLAVGRGAWRVRADERHPRPEAGAGGAARSRRPSCASSWTTCRRACRTSTATTGIASSTATTRSGWARAARNSPGARVAEVVGNERANAAGAAARPRAARARRSSTEQRAGAARRRAALGVGALRAEPRRRGQRHRHLCGAHRHPRPEAQRGGAEARQLDAVVAHQQHAAGGAGMGPRLQAGALVAAGARTSSAGAIEEVLGMPLDRQPARARGRSRGIRRPGRRA